MKTLNLIKSVILAALLLILLFTSLAYAQSQAACYFAPGGATLVVGSGCTLNVKSGGTVQVDSGAVGAMKFGATSDVVNNTLIAHGLGTTPTSILLTPFYAGTLTQSLYISASNATSFTVGIAAGSVTTVTTVYWAVAK